MCNNCKNTAAAAPVSAPAPATTDAIVEMIVKDKAPPPSDTDFWKSLSEKVHTRCAMEDVYIFQKMVLMAPDADKMARRIYETRHADPTAVKDGSANYEYLLKTNVITLGEIPEHWITKEMCLTALIGNNLPKWSVIPLKTDPEVCALAVRRGIVKYSDLPAGDHRMDKNVRDAAILVDGANIRYFPHDKEHHANAVAQCPHAVKFIIAAGYNTMNTLALTLDPSTIKYMPNEHHHVYFDVVKRGGQYLPFIPRIYQVQSAFIERAIETYPEIIGYYCDELCGHDRVIIEKALKIDGLLLRLLSERLRSLRHLQIIAIEQNPLASRYAL